MESLLDPAIWDRLFRLLVLLVVGWLAVFVFRSISTKRGPFLELLQTFLGWSVAAVGFVYATLIIAFAVRIATLIGWE